jgi:hypothetical protein
VVVGELHLKINYYLITAHFHDQDHVKIYLTLARIALDVLPVQASAIPCEYLFFAAKLIVTDCHAHLSPAIFEELQILKFAWHDKLINWAVLNAEEVEDIEEIFVCFLVEDDEMREWEQGEIDSWDHP